ncbi:replication initiator protein [robinz microvirus RP_97]|nr:replication initiator protein [robinz microvirus RP_97]
MACFYPLDAYRLDSGEIVFTKEGDGRPLILPCGRCIGCRLERSRQWAMRCVHEAQCHDANSFVTLTYDEAHFEPSLVYKDFALFMRRLRKRVLHPRFYMCGEYGENTLRPHFHALLFNVGFPDRYPWRMSGTGFQLYRSPLLEELWTAGQSEVGDVSFESAAYVARYVMKKVTGDLAGPHYTRVVSETGEVVQVVPEFCHMSRGIAREWIRRYNGEVYRGDGDAYCVVNGMKVKPPRYYDLWMDAHDLGSSEMDEVRHDRFKRSLLARDDSTPERLAVRETVTRARLRFKCRNLE